MKRCRWCHATIRPKPVARGGIESPSQWKARKFCSRHCWREYLGDRARTGPDRLLRLQRRTVSSRQFSRGQRVWYTRHFAQSFGWPVSVPARIIRYLDDYGRSRVVIVVFDRVGVERAVWTTERKLSARSDVLWFEEEPKIVGRQHAKTRKRVL